MSTRKPSGKKDTPVKHPPPPKPPPTQAPPPPAPPRENRFALENDAMIREQPHGAALDWAKAGEHFTVHGLARRPGSKAEVYAEIHFGSHRRYIVATAFRRHRDMLGQFGEAKTVNEKTKVELAEWQVRPNLGHNAILRKHPDDKEEQLEALKPGHKLGLELLNGKPIGDRNGFVWVSRLDHRVEHKSPSGKTVRTFDHTGWIRKNEIEPQKKS